MRHSLEGSLDDQFGIVNERVPPDKGYFSDQASSKSQRGYVSDSFSNEEEEGTRLNSSGGISVNNL